VVAFIEPSSVWDKSGATCTQQAPQSMQYSLKWVWILDFLLSLRSNLKRKTENQKKNILQKYI